MKNFTALLTGTLLSCAPHARKSAEARSLEQDLIVNVNPRHYVVDLERRHGEEQLRVLAENSVIEEGWVYLEMDVSGAKSTSWYEIGINEAAASVTYDDKFLQHLLDVYLFWTHTSDKKISTYHIHPFHTVDNKIKYFSAYSFPSYPSGNDLDALLRMSGEILLFTFDREAVQNYDERIADQNGLYVISYDGEHGSKKSADEMYQEVLAVYKDKNSNCPWTFPLRKSEANDEKAIICSKSFAERLDATATYKASFYSWDEHKEMK